MAVYVDDARIPWRGYRMCHMIADTSLELDDMAHALGLKEHWKQKPFEPDEHYDVAWSLRQQAIQLGAIPVSTRELVMKIREKRKAMAR